MKDFIIGFFKDEDGIQTIEMVIILVALVGIAFAFRKTLVDWYNTFVAEQIDTQQVGTPESPKAILKSVN